MPNNWESSWANFYSKYRLQAILKEDRDNNGADREIEDLGKQCIEVVVPRLLEHLRDVKPVLVHGDLLHNDGPS
jgi:fructosamine-3-kinase